MSILALFRLHQWVTAQFANSPGKAKQLRTGLSTLAIAFILAASVGHADVYIKPGSQLTWWEQKVAAHSWLRRLTGTEFSFNKSVAIVVGIDTYDHWDKLASPVNDAHRIRDFLISAGFDEIHTLTNKEVTRDSIQGLIKKFADELTANDRFFFYWTGHGGTHAQEEFGFLPLYDTAKDGGGDPIIMSEPRDWIRRIKASHTMLVLDTCFSGNALEPMSTARQVALERMANPVDLILASSTAAQESYGYSDGTGGVMTSALLRAVGASDPGKSADDNKDGLVTATEILSAVKSELQSFEGSQNFVQTPYLRTVGSQQAGEFFFVSKDAPAEADEDGAHKDLPQIEASGPGEDVANTTPVDATPQANDPGFTLDALALDGLANLVRQPDQQAIIIRPGASTFRRRQIDEKRQSILESVGAKTQELLLDAVGRYVLGLLQSGDTAPGQPIKPPVVSSANLYVTNDNDGQPTVERYVRSCGDVHELMTSARTAAELILVYKTLLTQFYGGELDKLHDVWGNGTRLSKNGETIDFDSWHMRTAELALDGWVGSGAFSNNYAHILNVVDQLDVYWRARIAVLARVALKYRANYESATNTRWELPFLPWIQDEPRTNPFGCDPEHDLQISVGLGFPNTDPKFVSFYYSQDKPALYGGFHDWMHAFWARRNAAGTDQALADFLSSLAVDISGPINWGEPTIYDVWQENEN